MKSDIILAGVGGQGILSIATVLGTAALADDLYIKQAEVHGMSQRGGDVQSNLRLSSEPVASDLIPLAGADLIISIEPMEALRYLPYLSPQGWVVTSTIPVVNIANYPPMERVMEELEQIDNVVALDMDSIARSVASARAANMVLLGAASPFIDLEPDAIRDAIHTIFAPKGPNIVDANVKAFNAGRDFALTMSSSKK
ncbi:MAG: indolepyruvate oxidoreductase subunit beta [Muribaculaceae bacterium]|nr:indolepyruvate oxidoreductase subunit beta [Muribaculaceae bacterium]